MRLQQRASARIESINENAHTQRHQLLHMHVQRTPCSTKHTHTHRRHKACARQSDANAIRNDGNKQQQRTTTAAVAALTYILYAVYTLPPRFGTTVKYFYTQPQKYIIRVVRDRASARATRTRERRCVSSRNDHGKVDECMGKMWCAVREIYA